MFNSLSQYMLGHHVQLVHLRVKVFQRTLPDPARLEAFFAGESASLARDNMLSTLHHSYNVLNGAYVSPEMYFGSNLKYFSWLIHVHTFGKNLKLLPVSALYQNEALVGKSAIWLVSFKYRYPIKTVGFSFYPEYVSESICILLN